MIKKLLSFILCGFGFFYSFLFKVRLLKEKKLPGSFVIGVGNVVVGGSGKTSFVVWLSNLLNSLNKKHFIVSRGYKKLSKGEVVVSDGKNILASVEMSGDEPFMLAGLVNNTPVVVGNKIKSLLLGVSLFNLKTCLVDDAYQSFGLGVDVNVLLLDMSLEIGDYKMFPVGLLREPLSAIKRANIIVYTKLNLNNKEKVKALESFFEKYIDKKKQLVLRSFYRSSLFFLNSYKKLAPVGPVSAPFSFPVYALVGIAQPSGFKKTISEHFSNVVFYNIVRDHFRYPSSFMKKLLLDFKKSGADALVTTRKDFFKIYNSLNNTKIYVVDIKHDVKDGFLIKDFFRNIL